MKTVLFAGASALALAAGAGWAIRAARTDANSPQEITVPLRGDHSAEIARASRNFLLYFVIPVWIAAGAADWLCHRASDIEHTAGPEESLLHLLLLAEVGVPALAGLLLEITSPCLR